MRLRALAVAALAAFAVGCGGDAPDEAPAKGRLVVERAGGVAGVQDRLVVRADGTGYVTHREGGPRERLAKADTREVRAALADSGFADLDDTYEPEGQVADAFGYRFVHGGKTVVVVEAGNDIPDGLARLKAAASELLAA